MKLNSIESGSSSQAEPKHPKIGKIESKVYQRKFSLVPFSRDIKKRNSDYEGEESFDPYETSNHFPQSN